MVVNVTGYLICFGIGYFLCLILERSDSKFAKGIFGGEADPKEAEDPEDPEDYSPLM